MHAIICHQNSNLKSLLQAILKRFVLLTMVKKTYGPCGHCGLMGHATSRSKKCKFNKDADAKIAASPGKKKRSNEDGKPKKKTDKELEKEQYKEPKTRWEKSNAKRLLKKDLLDGLIPLEATDEDGKRTTDLRTLYCSRIEFTKYHYSKFSTRLDSLRKTVRNEMNRQSLDEEAFNNYKANHPSLAYKSARGGYIQWQGSESQRLALQDIEAKKHLAMSKKDWYGERPEFYNEFPLEVFRSKIEQELRTAKYLYTLEVLGKDPRQKK